MEEVVHGDLAVENAPRFGVGDAKWGYVGVDEGVSGLGCCSKNASSLPQLVRFLRGEVVRLGGELHLAEMDDAVGASNDKLNLCTSLTRFLVCCLSPSRCVGANGSDSNGILDLAEMDKAEQLKGISLPVADDRRRDVVTPPMFIFGGVAGDEAEIEQGIEVNKMIDDILCLVTEMLIAMNEVTAFEIPKHLGQHAARKIAADDLRAALAFPLIILIGDAPR